MNNYDIYIPIDVRGPIKTSSRTNIQWGTSNNPHIMFQLFSYGCPLMLDDASKVTIAFTNTNNESVAGSGTLQIVNPHRGTISYVLAKEDITMFGIHTVTLGITTGDSFFTVQTTIFCQDIGSGLCEALGINSDSNSGSSSSSGNYYTYGNEFPCIYYNVYCRICRRCKWVWEHNTYPKPLCFEEIKMCKNPYVTPPIENFANLPNYEKANYPTMIDDDGNLVICINDVHYVCDIGKDGAIYLMDKTLETPPELVGLYLGSKMIPYYNIDQKLPESDFDIDSLFD